MPPTRVETDGSIWILDDDRGQYARMPKVEGPRPPGPNGEDWGGSGAGIMEDLKWHPMERWEIVEVPVVRAYWLPDYTERAGRVVTETDVEWIETGETKRQLRIFTGPDLDRDRVVVAPNPITEGV